MLLIGVILCLQDERIPEDSLDSMITAASLAGVSHMVINGCWPGDWPRVLSLASRYPENILPQLGLHPWWVSRRAEGGILNQPGGESKGKDETDIAWLVTLRRLLHENPTAGLGECGLDKGTKALARASWEDQLQAFKLQLQLAEELQRPVSVHCVKSFGAVHDMLCQVNLTVPVVLHAWTGTAEMTELFLKLPNVYFSLGGGLTTVAPKKAFPMLRLLGEKALDRCLIESDAPDGALHLTEAWIDFFPPLAQLKKDLEFEQHKDEISPTTKKVFILNTPTAIRHMLKLVAIVLGKSETDIAQATRTNAQRVFC
jgi:TatD DNase family protein